MGSSLISYGPLGTPPDNSRCPNGIARCTKVHLEGSQMHKSASGGEPDAQKCIWRCPNGSPECPGALSKGGQICGGSTSKSRVNKETVDPSAVPNGTC